MGKKDKDPAPNPAHIPNKDIIQRLNFLYQASVYLTNLSHVIPPSSLGVVAKDDDDDDGKQEDNPVRNRNRDQDPKLVKKQKSKRSRRALRLRTRTADELARAYVDTMATVGKKTVVQMDPSIKRTICEACRGVLVPGVSVQIRIRRSSSHRHAVVLRCARCGYSRRLPAPARKGWDGRGRWEQETTNAPSTNHQKEGKEEKEEEEEEVEKSDGVLDESETAKAAKETKETKETKKTKKKKKKKKGQSHRVYPPLPLSARRDAGHVVFRGTDRVDVRMDEVDEVGDGVFAV